MSTQIITPINLELSQCSVSSDGDNNSQKLSELAKTTNKTVGDVTNAIQKVDEANKKVDEVLNKVNNTDFLIKTQLIDNNNTFIFPHANGDTWIQAGYIINENGSSTPNPQSSRVIHQDYINDNIIVQEISLSYDGINAYKQFWGKAYNPSDANHSDLGTSTLPWNNLYISNAPIVTSDINTKTIIASSLSEDTKHQKLLDAVYEISAKLYQLNSVIEEKGADKARLHSGFIAQELQKAIENQGLDPFDYGLWVQSPAYDSKDVETGEINPITGKVETKREYFLKKDENNNQVYIQSLRYEEVFSLLAEAFKQKLNTIEMRLSQLEAKGSQE